jgi:hypothetical protein
MKFVLVLFTSFLNKTLLSSPGGSIFYDCGTFGGRSWWVEQLQPLFLRVIVLFGGRLLDFNICIFFDKSIFVFWFVFNLLPLEHRTNPMHVCSSLDARACRKIHTSILFINPEYCNLFLSGNAKGYIYHCI